MSGLMPHTVGSNPVGICAADDPRQLGLARHPDLGAGLADDLPVAGVGHRPDDGVLRVELGEGAGVGLRGHHEREVLVQEHRHQQRGGVVGVDRAVIDELANAAPLHHGVVVTLDQLGLVDQVAGFGVVPTRLGVVFPADQPGGPGQLEDAGRRQFVVDLHLEPGARRAVRADFGAADDDHQVGRVDVEVIPCRRWRRGESARRGRQRGDGALGRGSSSASVARRWPARAPWRPVRPCRGRRRRARRSGPP